MRNSDKPVLVISIGGPGEKPGSLGGHFPDKKKKNTMPILSLPVAALSEGAPEGEAVSPEVGDEVSLEVSGVVRSIDGDNAEVEVRSANGHDCGGGEEEKPAPDAEKKSLKEMAEAEDEEAGR